MNANDALRHFRHEIIDILLDIGHLPEGGTKVETIKFTGGDSWVAAFTGINEAVTNDAGEGRPYSGTIAYNTAILGNPYSVRWAHDDVKKTTVTATFRDMNEYEARVLLRDALYEFSAKRENADAYVRTRNPSWDEGGQQFADKVDEVTKRSNAARVAAENVR